MKRSRWIALTVAAFAVALVTAGTAAGASRHHPGDAYTATPLVSNQAGMAPTVDSNLKNAWGISAGPATPWWVANNGTDTSTLYDAAGTPFPLPPLRRSSSPSRVHRPARSTTAARSSWSRTARRWCRRSSSSRPRPARSRAGRPAGSRPSPARTAPSGAPSTRASRPPATGSTRPTSTTAAWTSSTATGCP